MKPKTFLILLFGLSFFVGQSQSYTFEVARGQYTDLSESTSIDNTFSWREAAFNFPIGFDFEYFDDIINNMSSLTGQPATLIDLFVGQLTVPLLIPFGANLIDRGEFDGTSLSNFSYLLTGNVGNRILKVEWKNAGFLGDVSSNGTSIDFANVQMWLYEGSNNIEFQYGPSLITDPEATGPFIGLYEIYDYTNRAFPGENIALSGNPESPNITAPTNTSELSYLNGMPSNGTIYRFKKVVRSCEPPTGINFTDIAPTSAKINWIEDGIYRLEYRIQGATDYTQINNIRGTNYTLTNLVGSNSKYEIRLTQRCTDGAFSNPSTTYFLILPLTCGDNFYDSGGINGEYSDDESETYLICPNQEGEQVSLVFTSFSLENDYDFLTIYNSNIVGENLIGRYTGTDIPEVINANNNSGCLIAVFESDGSVTRSGWAANIICGTCVPPTPPTASNITADNATISWGGEGEFTISYRIQGANEAEQITVNTNPYTLTNLEANTTYEVSIATICDDGTISGFSVPVIFTTAQSLRCGTTFYDSGGASANYSNNESQEYIICPDQTNQRITLVFNEFSLEGCCDYLRIYDSNVVDQNLIGAYNGSDIPAIITASNSTGCLAVQFTSDHSVTRSGWAADIICNVGECTEQNLNIAITPSCYNERNGQININTNQITEPYTIFLNDRATSNVITDLWAGNYTIKLIDGTGCLTDTIITVTEYNRIDIEEEIITDLQCNDQPSGGIIISEVTGGTDPYTYIWSNGSTENNLTGLSRGYYRLTIEDSNGCTRPFYFYVPENTNQLRLNPITTNGCFGENNTLIDLNIRGGLSPYVIRWSDSNEEERRVGIAYGNYTATVTDQQGCSIEENFIISPPSEINANIDVLSVCGEAETSIQVQGGVSPYRISWSNGRFGTEANGFGEGSHSVQITDANNCTKSFDFVVEDILEIPPRPEITLPEGNIICKESEAILIANVTDNILWSTGETTQNIAVSEPGRYSLIQTGENGCVSEADVVNIRFATDAYIDYSVNSQTICEGQSITLRVRNATNADWSNDSVGLVLTVAPTTDTSYFVIATNDIGCVYELEAKINVIPFAEPGVATELLPPDASRDLAQPLTISWNRPENSSIYDLYIWKVEETEPSRATYSNLTTNNRTINNLEYDQAYNWKVVAKNNCFEGASSETQSFNIKPRPDLLVTEINAPTMAVSESEIAIAWNVLNTSESSTGQGRWIERIFLSRDEIFGDENDIPLGIVNNQSALEASEAYAQTATFQIPRGVNGTYFVYVLTDASNRLTESDENNNGAFSENTIQIELAPFPDLQVKDVSLPGAAGIVIGGESYNMQWNTINDAENATGNLRNANWLERIYLSPTAEFNSYSARQIGQKYQANQSINLGDTLSSITSVNIPIFLEGDYYVCIQTDRNNQVYEYDFELNNTTCVGLISITAPSTPNFTVAAIELIAENAVSETLPIRVRLKNIAADYEGNLSNRIDLINLDNSRYNRVFYQNYSNISFESDTEIVFDRNIPLPDVVGNYRIRVFTDHNNAIYEHQGENDNIKTSDAIRIDQDSVTINDTTLVVDYPDIEVLDIAVPDTVLAGGFASITYILKNSGGFAVNNQILSDQILMGQDTAITSAIPLTLSNTPLSLAVNQMDTFQVTVRIPNGYDGRYQVFVKSNFGQRLNENGRFSNNTSSTSTYVLAGEAADLVPTLLQITGNEFRLGGQLNARSVVENEGTAPISAPYLDKIFLSPNPNWNEEEAILLRQITRSQLLQTDSTYTLTYPLTIPTNITSGTYYFYYVSDAEDNIYERDQAAFNNILRSEAFTLGDYPNVDVAASTATARGTFQSGQRITLNYTAKNRSNLPLIRSTWKDALYLSLDETLDPSTDVLVKEWTVNRNLSANQTYTNNIAATIPYSLALGSYRLILLVDKNAVHTDNNRANNSLVATIQDESTGETGTDVDIDNQMPPNLSFEDFSIPLVAEAGQPVTVSWMAKNDGGSTANRTWVDKVFLSTDSRLGGGDIELGHSTIQDSLAVNESYENQLNVTIPTNAEGNYYLIIQLNNGRLLVEENTNDNTAVGFINIISPLPSDLIVSQVFAPDNVQTGATFTLYWEIQNIGEQFANGNYTTGIYLSQDTIWDVDDVFLDTKFTTTILAPNASVEQQQDICITEAALQDYYVLVKVDLLNNIIETNEVNNTTASEAVSVNVPQLVFHTLTPDSLPQQKALYYRIEVADSLAGETMKVSLLANDSTSNAINELYIAHEAVPTRTTHDFAHIFDFSANQELTVPSLQTGTYYLMAFSNDSVQAINLLAELIPFEIESVHANQGGDIGLVTVELTGAKFQSGMTFQLEQGDSTITQSYVRVVDPTLAYATFDLAGQPLGTYDIRGIRRDSAETVLPQSFEIVKGIPAELDIEVEYPEQVRVNRDFSMVITFRNIGNVNLSIDEKILIGLDGVPVNLDIEQLESGFSALRIDDNPFNNSIRPGEERSILVYATADRIGDLNFKISAR